MSQNDDDIREVRPRGDLPTERLLPVAPDPLPLPTPEPLTAAEPPPVATAFDVPAPPARPEISWRNQVAVPRPEQPREYSDFYAQDPRAGEPEPYGAPPPPPAPYAGQLIAFDQMRHDGAERQAAAAPMIPAPHGTPEGLQAAPQAASSGITLGRIGEELFAWLKTLASAAVYATLIVTFGFQVARVEGQSMAPTLEDQDRLIVNKLAYRIGQPQVGDIVMLYYPLNPEKSFVKRVIAEESDQIRIVDGRVYRNDVQINDDYVPPEFRSHDDWGPEVVPQGYYFVMGDHRNNSSDSRHWRFVPKKYIIGKVQLRWWPLPHARMF